MLNKLNEKIKNLRLYLDDMIKYYGKMYFEGDENMSMIDYTKLQEVIINIMNDQNISYADFGVSEEKFNDVENPCFDMALIKKLAGSNTEKKGSISSNQSSIMLTGEQGAIFPCVKRAKYFGELLGKNMVFKIKVNIMKNNMLYMQSKSYTNENKVIQSYLITNETTDDRIEMGCKTLDGEEYVEFYETFTKDCFLVILKLKGEFRYIILAVNYEDAQKYFGDLKIDGKIVYFLYKINRVSKKNIKDVTYIDTDNISFVSSKIKEQHNRLIYGAPGTGKSNLLKKDIEKYNIDEDHYERVTFYPDYSYGQFVGMYKPISDGKDIKYDFVVGPFLRLLSKALKSKEDGTNEDFVLIVEEINRANAAYVFGDMFQLLDRDEYGKSEYDISISKDMEQFFAKDENPNISKLYLPDNFYIWATMNSGDQGVMPLDSAFKRRFDDYKLVSIDENEDVIKGIRVNINGVGNVEWNDFRKALNIYLIETFNVKEDKLIGPFFIKPKVLKDSVLFDRAFEDKLLMYLAEDVLNYNKQRLFGTNSLSKIKENYKCGNAFTEEFWSDIVNLDNIQIGISNIEIEQA